MNPLLVLTVLLELVRWSRTPEGQAAIAAAKEVGALLKTALEPFYEWYALNRAKAWIEDMAPLVDEAIARKGMTL